MQENYDSTYEVTKAILDEISEGGATGRYDSTY